MYIYMYIYTYIYIYIYIYIGCPDFKSSKAMSESRQGSKKFCLQYQFSSNHRQSPHLYTSLKLFLNEEKHPGRFEVTVGDNF